MGAASPAWSARREVLRLAHRSRRDVTISLTAYPAPSRLHSWRNGRSVTPAIGATKSGFGNSIEPICTDGICSMEETTNAAAEKGGRSIARSPLRSINNGRDGSLAADAARGARTAEVRAHDGLRRRARVGHAAAARVGAGGVRARQAGSL